MKFIPKYVSTAFKVFTEFKDLTNDVIQQLALVQFAKSESCSTPADVMKLIHEHDLHSTFTNVGYPWRFECSCVYGYSFKLYRIENAHSAEWR